MVLGILTRGIMPHTGDAHKKFTPLRNQEEMRQLHFISPTLYHFKNEIDIYDENIGIMSLTKGTEHGIIIRSRSIAESMGAVFEALWQTSNEK